jgi:aldehyde dehydrogenase (NAD+)
VQSGRRGPRAAVARAREAEAWWQAQGPDGRRTHLRAWKGVIARRIHELADLVHKENGKPHADAVLEIVLAVDHIEWAAKKAPKVLGPRRVASGLMAANQASTLEYQPLGVIGVIGPWNYPVFTPMGSIAYALAAGNAVVFKPSEYTPGVGRWLEHAWQMAVPERPDVLQVVTGLGATGAALCHAGVDKIAFTGSAATGRKVMAACAEHLTPVLMECGGKDAMIVDDDANVAAAADAALWGGMSNAGPDLHRHRARLRHRQGLRRVRARAHRPRRTVRPGSDPEASYGPITMPSQIGIIQRHIADALDRGGRALDRRRPSRARSCSPTVLVDVPRTARRCRRRPSARPSRSPRCATPRRR